jgi:hypothetical protein
VELKLYLWWRGMLGLREEKGVKLETGVCLVADGNGPFARKLQKKYSRPTSLSTIQFSTMAARTLRIGISTSNRQN